MAGSCVGESDGLTFWVAEQKDYDDVMSISVQIYGGNDYLPHRYADWMTEPDRVVILGRRDGKLVRVVLSLSLLPSSPISSFCISPSLPLSLSTIHPSLCLLHPSLNPSSSLPSPPGGTGVWSNRWRGVYSGGGGVEGVSQREGSRRGWGYPEVRIFFYDLFVYRFVFWHTTKKNSNKQHSKHQITSLTQLKSIVN